MPIIKNDTRLINGDFSSAIVATKEYLSNVGYEVDCEEIKEESAEIEAKNLQQSFIKLYLTNSPQIVHFHFEKKSEEQIQIEIKCDLFRKFRIFYYAFLILFLMGSYTFLLTILPKNVEAIIPMSKWESLQSFSLLILISLFCFIFACGFFMRSISTFPYENFMNQFYDSLIKEGFSNKNDIHVGHSFPDMWKVLLLMGIFFLPMVLCIGIDNDIREHTFLSSFLNGAFLIMGLLSIILILMNFQPKLKARMFFALQGFSFCIPILLYFSPPIILSITGDVGELFKQYLGNGYPLQIIQYGSIFYLTSVVVIITIAIFSLMDTLQLPIRITMQLDKSSIMHPDSTFNKSLQVENTFFVFNSLLILVWGTFWFVKIIGLYFTFTIMERVVFSSNYFFNSKLAILFFENIKTSFLFLWQSKIDSNLISIFHRTIMLLYATPMIAFVFLIFRKNLKLSLEEYSLIKKQSKSHTEIEKQISKKIKKMCEYTGISLPIIKVIDSLDINAETKYLGFPLFKNILVIPQGTWDELKENEGELDILLAHEIWHIKKHNLLRRTLCFISDYSFFGNGFLTLLQNSFQIEREADDFAAKWIVQKYGDGKKAVSLLRSLLERIEEANWKNTMFQQSSFSNFSMLKNSSNRTGFLEMFNESSRIQKVKINLRLFLQIYFGEEIQSYFHPSNDQRINWVKEKYSTNETN